MLTSNKGRQSYAGVCQPRHQAEEENGIFEAEAGQRPNMLSFGHHLVFPYAVAPVEVV